jgi:hypothetical protein
MMGEGERGMINKEEGGRDNYKGTGREGEGERGGGGERGW